MDAVILAAGLGTRIKDYMGVIGKQFIRIHGLELLLYPILSLWLNNTSFFQVVVNPIVMDGIDKLLKHYSRIIGFDYDLSLNPYMDSGNGNSLIIGLRDYVRNRGDKPVIVSVSDHVFHPLMITNLTENGSRSERDIIILADPSPVYVDISEATKILVVDDKVVAAGKNLKEYNYVDTGLFIFNNPGKVVGEYINIYTSREIMLVDIIANKAFNTGIAKCKVKCLWKDVDTLDDLYLLAQMNKPRLPEQVINEYKRVRVV